MPKTNDEIRSTREYAQAYLNAIRTRDDSECRALLTENVSGGYVPVPTDLETEIKTAWEEHKLMGLVKHSDFKGNVKIGFEVSATGAEVHVEGAAAPQEERVVLGVVEIKAQTLKKWIRISDEALQGTTVDTAGYLYKEIAHKIVELAEEVLIGKIDDAPATATATAVGVPVYESAPAIDTVLEALARLAGEAGNLNIVMNRATFPAFRRLEMTAGYGIDVFEGLKDRIIFSDKLPAYAAATDEATYAIIGDFGKGFQANFPNVDNISLLVDPYTDAESDLVKIVGKQYVGMEPVADRHFVKITKPAQG